MNKRHFDLNTIPTLIRSGKLTEAQAVKFLAVFVNNNAQVFDLHTKDEDFRSDVVLHILERGPLFLDKYNSSYGNFFNYFYSFIRSIKNSVVRTNTLKSIKHNHSITEAINDYEETKESYDKKDSQRKILNVPYQYKTVSYKDFQIACKSDKYSIKKYIQDNKDSDSPLIDNLSKISPITAKKIILILALKSAYYLSDQQIQKVSELCNVNENLLRNLVFELKETLSVRERNKKMIEARRNNAYFNHCKYQQLIDVANNSDNPSIEYTLSTLLRKYGRHTKTWQEINSLLEKGYLNIRPSNKTIAEILGLCERQVSYYINHAKELGKEL